MSWCDAEQDRDMHDGDNDNGKWSGREEGR
jgi:hypothetical protein